MNNTNDSSSLAFRVWLWGPFRVEKWVGESYEVVRTADWGGSNYPRLLFKALLCSPMRQARREALLDLLWPEADFEQASANLNTATTKLRRLLRPGHGQASWLVTKDDSTLYSLPAQAILWTDMDRAQEALAAAEQDGRTSRETLPLLEEAVTLFHRGSFLDGEEGQWAMGKRATRERESYRVQLWLAESYMQHGMAGRAENILTTLLEHDPFDEDVLCRLMTLLHVQGMTHQALVLYRQMQDVFTQEQMKLSEATNQLAARMEKERPIPPLISSVEKDAPERFGGVRALKPMLLDNVREYTNSSLTPALLASQQHILPSDFSHPVTQDIMGGARIAEERNSMDQRRRQFLQQAFKGTGIALLATPNLVGLMQVGKRLHAEEILSLSATSLPILWRLYFDGQLSEVQRTLPGYISQLALLVRQSTDYQHRAARLASQAHQLACMLALQDLDYGSALIQVDQALQSADIADDMNGKAASLIRKALVYRYINRTYNSCPNQILLAYQEAEHASTALSLLLRGRVFAGLSDAYSELGQADEAKRALEQAYTLFPERPQDDPHFSYTHFKLPQKFEALLYLNLKQAKKAQELLAQVDASIPAVAVPDRVELSLDQTRAALLAGDLHQSCHYLEAAVTSATVLGSPLRIHEASYLYQQMQIRWPDDGRVRALAGCFSLS